ncbi:MAG TPA: serine/threonine-protein kinase, partial [Polyangiaceae bacterium]|nr:serine/threonine-protein kinase [Polyangiaceae bacterium]
MNDPQPPPARGLVAGKYELVRLIGRGGMGSVWEGRHASLGTRVAIKFIDPEYVGSREAQARFATEARAVATIQSKHAIQIFDHGVTEDGRPYIVMELLVGEPLDKRVERRGRISLPETARILGQVSRALQRAHDAGIIHRDLKPENIFLVRSPDDDDEIAKVLDFGIAKIKGAPGDAGLTSSTKTGAVLGTPYYMSPEQARGLRTLDHRSDLWSLGVIAYKCVTGVLPFDGESVGDLLVKICTAPPPVPSIAVPGLPKAFDGWFSRALERDPARRYATAAELGEALAMTAGISARRALDEQPFRGALDATVPLAIVAPTQAEGITSAPFTASAHAARSSRGVLIAVLAAALVGGSVGVLAVVKLMSAKPGAQVAVAGPTASAPPVTPTATATTIA